MFGFPNRYAHMIVLMKHLTLVLLLVVMSKKRPAAEPQRLSDFRRGPYASASSAAFITSSSFADKSPYPMLCLKI